MAKFLHMSSNLYKHVKFFFLPKQDSPAIQSTMLKKLQKLIKSGFPWRILSAIKFKVVS
jgi:hypothetical protein